MSTPGSIGRWLVVSLMAGGTRDRRGVFRRAFVALELAVVSSRIAHRARVTLFRMPAAASRVEMLKAPTDILGLDEITGGGLPAGRPTLICGGSGSGKTLLGYQLPRARRRRLRPPPGEAGHAGGPAARARRPWVLTAEAVGRAKSSP